MSHVDLSRLHPTTPQSETFVLPLSKSLLARQMILASSLEVNLSLEGVDLETLPEDIVYLQEALTALHQGKAEICVGESGTAMRLMTALMACKVQRPTILYGLGRQHDRPIAPLVDALRNLGADISYQDKDGYPPLLIRPSLLEAKSIELDASASSQYLSALMLIAPCLKGEGYYSVDVGASGLVSAPYAMMTMDYMQSLGLAWRVEGDVFHYLGKKDVVEVHQLRVEADWTAASYAYQHLALLPQGSSLYLPNLRLPSLQGDSLALPRIYEGFGICTLVGDEGITIERISDKIDMNPLQENCDTTPDIAPTLVASCVASERPFCLAGVAHLRIKESDRLEAIRTECAKVGAHVELGADYAKWNGTLDLEVMNQDQPILLDEYGDHRIAMALAPLLIHHHTCGVRLMHPEVVAKSFPTYWQQIDKLSYITQN